MFEIYYYQPVQLLNNTNTESGMPARERQPHLKFLSLSLKQTNATKGNKTMPTNAISTKLPESPSESSKSTLTPFGSTAYIQRLVKASNELNKNLFIAQPFSCYTNIPMLSRYYQHEL